jgi:hypothetical protein
MQIPNEQPDVIVAMRNPDAARADVQRTDEDIEKAYIRAHAAGTILTIHVRPSEKPGSKGVLNMGDTAHMTAEIEVCQTQIGTVARIGLEVARQTCDDSHALRRLPPCHGSATHLTSGLPR